ncbi:hypothetical protein Taro_007968 [Colocasia esculenta]|uniref:Phosphatidylinositol N-acetylglucosaminyltransferase subunit H conserved domain-containing protein n=1 Tax=Colocasia esculenta TaxID=4460 RepID=A0A843U1Z0_COLES|nr:hypothetical protein [Colocasia esculenta]
MPKAPMVDSRYTYCHENKKRFHEGIDVHEIIISTSKGRSLFSFFCALLFVLHVTHMLRVKEKLGVFIFVTPLLSVFIAKVWLLNALKKESIIVMPAFGFQFETHSRSGRVVRHFVSIGKILKPVLNEVVTSVTCYWSLALILRGEDKLMLVFQESRPPVKILVPIWRALCAATSVEADSEVSDDILPALLIETAIGIITLVIFCNQLSAQENELSMEADTILDAGKALVWLLSASSWRVDVRQAAVTASTAINLAISMVIESTVEGICVRKGFESFASLRDHSQLSVERNKLVGQRNT